MNKLPAELIELQVRVDSLSKERETAQLVAQTIEQLLEKLKGSDSLAGSAVLAAVENELKEAKAQLELLNKEVSEAQIELNIKRRPFDLESAARTAELDLTEENLDRAVSKENAAREAMEAADKELDAVRVQCYELPDESGSVVNEGSSTGGIIASVIAAVVAIAAAIFAFNPKVFASLKF